MNLLIPKTEYIRDKKHLKFVASLPCILCMRKDVQAAHIRSGNGAGMGLKSGDNFTVPLCISCHKHQHNVGNEKSFWRSFGGIDKASATANELYKHSGDIPEGLLIVGKFYNDYKR